MVTANLNSAEQAFLEKVRAKADLPNVYDAENLTNLVFRTLRDMMPNAMDERTQSAFSDANLSSLWQDDNPIVSFLSQLRPPLTIDTETFLRRIEQEGSLPTEVTARAATVAVFSTAREELPLERVNDIASRLPDALKILWEQV